MNKNLDDFLDYSKLKWSRNLKRSLRNGQSLALNEQSVRKAAYRPFANRYLYFQDVAIDELGQCPRFFPTEKTGAEN